jgi:hypothetical protein
MNKNAAALKKRDQQQFEREDLGSTEQQLGSHLLIWSLKNCMPLALMQ